MQRRLGRILIWIGVLAWVPYGIVRYGLGEEVSPAPFLAVHLLGVVPGAILRHGRAGRGDWEAPRGQEAGGRDGWGPGAAGVDDCP